MYPLTFDLTRSVRASGTQATLPTQGDDVNNDDDDDMKVNPLFVRGHICSILRSLLIKVKQERNEFFFLFSYTFEFYNRWAGAGSGFPHMYSYIKYCILRYVFKI